DRAADGDQNGGKDCAMRQRPPPQVSEDEGDRMAGVARKVVRRARTPLASDQTPIRRPLECPRPTHLPSNQAPIANLSSSECCQTRVKRKSELRRVRKRPTTLHDRRWNGVIVPTLH